MIQFQAPTISVNLPVVWQWLSGQHRERWAFSAVASQASDSLAENHAPTGTHSEPHPPQSRPAASSQTEILSDTGRNQLLPARE